MIERFHHGGEDRSGKIKYDFSVNVNPFGMPESVKKALLENPECFEDYPDSSCSRLREAIAESISFQQDVNGNNEADNKTEELKLEPYSTVDKEMKKSGPEPYRMEDSAEIGQSEKVNWFIGPEQIVCGNGASDLIYRICGALGFKRALIAVPTFSEYERALRQYGCEVDYLNIGRTGELLDGGELEDAGLEEVEKKDLGDRLNRLLQIGTISEDKVDLSVTGADSIKTVRNSGLKDRNPSDTDGVLGDGLRNELDDEMYLVGSLEKETHRLLSINDTLSKSTVESVDFIDSVDFVDSGDSGADLDVELNLKRSRSLSINDVWLRDAVGTIDSNQDGRELNCSLKIFSEGGVNIADYDAFFLCSPMNPSGGLLQLSVLKMLADICGRTNAKLIIDECFIEFTENSSENSMLKYISQMPQLIVLRAFTKIYGMAGIRLGYGVFGNLYDAERVSSFGPPWSVSGPAQAAGIAALGDKAYIEETVKYIKEQRTYIMEEIRQMLCEWEVRKQQEAKRPMGEDGNMRTNETIIQNENCCSIEIEKKKIENEIIWNGAVDGEEAGNKKLRKDKIEKNVTLRENRIEAQSDNLWNKIINRESYAFRGKILKYHKKKEKNAVCYGKNCCEVFSSDANYVLFRGPAGLGREMAKLGVAIRDCSDYVGLEPEYAVSLNDDVCLRDTVSVSSDNDVYLKSVGDILTNTDVYLKSVEDISTNTDMYVNNGEGRRCDDVSVKNAEDGSYDGIGVKNVRDMSYDSVSAKNTEEGSLYDDMYVNHMGDISFNGDMCVKNNNIHIQINEQKSFNDFHIFEMSYFRVAVRLKEENDIMLNAMRRCLSWL